MTFLLVFSGIAANAQSQVFLDDFNRSVLTTGAPATYTVTARGGATTANASILSSTMLQFTSSSANSSIYITGPLSAYSSPSAVTLSSNTTAVTWTFNMRISDAAAGIGGGTYGLATVLAGTNATVYNNGNGYAVKMNVNGSVSLVAYTTGLNGTLTTIATSSNAMSSPTNYASVKVTYNPTGNVWMIWLRDDGSSGFVDAGTGIYTGVSTATNSTYTSSATNTFGFYYNSSNVTGRSGLFDNYKVVRATTCSGSPIPGDAIASAYNSCATSYTTTLSLPMLIPATNYTYQWQSSTSGAGFTDIPGAVNATYAASVNSSSNVYYRANVTCPSVATVASGAVFVNMSGASTLTPPALENFDAGTPTPCGWSIVNVNGGSTWAVTGATPANGSSPNVIQYGYTSTLTGDDWVFTKGYSLTAGKSYALNFKFGNNSSTYIEKLEVKYGAAQSVAGMTSSAIFSNANITTNSVLYSSNGVTMTAPTSGVYYFGFHAFSAANQYNLYVDDISIIPTQLITASPTNYDFGSLPVGTPSALQNIAISVSNLSSGGSITITAPANFQVYNGSSWVSTYNYTYSGTSIVDYNIPVRFTAPSVSVFTGTLTIAGGGHGYLKFCVAIGYRIAYLLGNAYTRHRICNSK
ncbi:hypothetical protein CJD36_005070 [Flavipsychrobacter stenotrophus]|uniref:Cleaved adhesin domain-containing protein n=2 Tax=Flavipsychrobacter stenotrophus TaxID=2077091 RepID=A0A2S7T2X9_9BACT|nr:hypothetical protein CJD36_005070 [Flavipsychrobacter stenotrophus]